MILTQNYLKENVTKWKMNGQSQPADVVDKIRTCCVNVLNMRVDTFGRI